MWKRERRKWERIVGRRRCHAFFVGPNSLVWRFPSFHSVRYVRVQFGSIFTWSLTFDRSHQQIVLHFSLCALLVRNQNFVCSVCFLPCTLSECFPLFSRFDKQSFPKIFSPHTGSPCTLTSSHSLCKVHADDVINEFPHRALSV